MRERGENSVTAGPDLSVCSAQLQLRREEEQDRIIRIIKGIKK